MPPLARVTLAHEDADVAALARRRGSGHYGDKPRIAEAGRAGAERLGTAGAHAGARAPRVDGLHADVAARCRQASAGHQVDVPAAPRIGQTTGQFDVAAIVTEVGALGDPT